MHSDKSSIFKSYLNVCLYCQAEIETHAKPGSLSVYVHYGQSRPKDAKNLAQSDVVITTYGVLASEYSAEVSKQLLPVYHADF